MSPRRDLTPLEVRRRLNALRQEELWTFPELTRRIAAVVPSRAHHQTWRAFCTDLDPKKPRRETTTLVAARKFLQFREKRR